MPFGSLDGAKSAATEIPARIVITRLLAAHATAGGTELRAKATLSTKETRKDPQIDVIRRGSMQFRNTGVCGERAAV